MSAPTTNVEKQTRRHRWALWGMAAAAVLALLSVIVFAALGDEDGVLGIEPATATSDQ